MDMNVFRKANIARCESPKGFNHQLQSWSLSDWMTATMGELGEAANIVKKLNRMRDQIRGNIKGEELTRLLLELRRELADVYIYLDLMAAAAGVDLSIAVVEVFNKKSMDINYPFYVDLAGVVHAKSD